MSSSEYTLPTIAETNVLNELTAQLSQFNWKDGVVDKAKRLLYSPDIADNIQGVMNLKAMLCIGREEVYEVAQEVIDAGVICRLVEFLNIENRDLQCPAAFCLTNVAAGLDSQTQIVVQAGAIEPLIRFLSHPDPYLRRQAVFCLANIAGSTPQHRVLLAEHPRFFPGLFSVARMATDIKIVELVCWNLRNTCLFGGPSFNVLRPGVMFLYESILKQYWSYKDKSVCVGFALETLCTVCQHAEGRQCLLEAGFFGCLISVLSRLPTNASSINESALKCLTSIFLSESREYHQLLLSQHRNVLELLLNHALLGLCGSSSQELVLKCLVCIASEDVLRVQLLQQHENLFNIVQRFILDQPLELQNVENSNGAGAEAKTISQTSRLCACFLFCHFVLTACRSPEMVMKLLASSQAVLALLTTLDMISHSELVEPESSPLGLPGLLTSTMNLALQALVELLQQGKALQQIQKLVENPTERHLMSCSAPNKLQYWLQTLPPQTRQTIALILQQLTNSPSSF